MKNVTIKQLRYFEALARHGHFGRAAEASAISQPALSMQIRDLEERLGAPLFERGARNVRLTGFGEEIARRVRQVLSAFDDLGDFARSASARPMGHLRLGIIPTIAPYLLPAVLRDLMRRHPGMDLRIRESLTPHLIADLVEARLDAAIVALPVSEPAFEEVPILTEEFLLVRPQAEAASPPPGPDDLRGMRLLLLEEGHCFRDQALSYCSLTTNAPRDALDGSSLSTLVQMAGAGIGVTLIPEMAAKIETRSAPVTLTRFAAPRPERTIGMIWRRSNPVADRLREISEIVREAAT